MKDHGKNILDYVWILINVKKRVKMIYIMKNQVRTTNLQL
jgi:hypothetical protein